MLQTQASREVLEGPIWVSKVHSEDDTGVIVVLVTTCFYKVLTRPTLPFYHSGRGKQGQGWKLIKVASYSGSHM
jgi:hypothetical protein